MKPCLKTAEQQTLEFITFCTELYTGKKNVSGGEVAKMFCDSGEFEFFGSDGNMTEINQSNFRSLLPVKEAHVIMKIKQDKKLTLKEAYRTFFASEIYRQLETEETKRWWQSAEQIFEDGK